MWKVYLYIRKHIQILVHYLKRILVNIKTYQWFKLVCYKCDIINTRFIHWINMSLKGNEITYFQYSLHRIISDDVTWVTTHLNTFSPLAIMVPLYDIEPWPRGKYFHKFGTGLHELHHNMHWLIMQHVLEQFQL